MSSQKVAGCKAEKKRKIGDKNMGNLEIISS
jgi:hypothetical protein